MDATRAISSNVSGEYRAYFKGVDVRLCCQMHECLTLSHLESVAKALFVP
jgi:hypothetical protein